MDSPEQIDQVEAEVTRLRAALLDDGIAPFGIVSRLQAAVAREAAEGTRLGWEPRVVVACLVYAMVTEVMPAAPSSGFAPVVATVAFLYVCLASWPARLS